MANPFNILASANFNQINSNSFTDCGISSSSTQKQTQLSVTPESDWGDIDSFCNKYGFYQDNPLEELLFMPKNKEPILAVSSEIPKNLNGANSRSVIEVSQKLSTDQILKMAGKQFVRFSSKKFEHAKTLYKSSLVGLSFEDKQDVELAQLLLGAAEKVGQEEFDRARKLLSHCQWIASNDGTSVQRVVFYFSEALLERINKETQNSEEFKGSVVANESCVKRNVQALIAMHQKLPFFQVIHLTAVQAILENIETKSKVLHLIDFHILSGTHWATFMQAITEREIGHLKITAVETADNRGAEKTGTFLQSFASCLNLSFSYKVVSLPDFKDLKEEHLETQPDENVAILFHFMLRSLITKPICMNKLMRITQKMKPSIIVVGEVEANHNSHSFVNRFVEALFYYGGLFDSLEESMGRDNIDRMVLESGTFREGIRNIVSKEGYERVSRKKCLVYYNPYAI